MIDAGHASTIAKALDALEVRSPTSHSWMGQVAHLPEVVVRLADPRGVRRALVGSIRARLYDSFFTQGSPRPATAPESQPPGEERALSCELAAANEGAGWLEPGWRVVGYDDGRWVVQRADLRLWVTPDDIEFEGDAPRAGEVVALRQSADMPALAPGFYVVRGDRGFSPGRSRVLDRVYFDLHREGAASFVRESSRRLNGAGLAFVAKVVDEMEGFERRDAAVLYFERRDRGRALEAVDHLARTLVPFLGTSVPAMTHRLERGVAFAEDPGGEESFGSHRCLLIAEAAVAAAERGVESLEDRLDLVRERFVAAGTSLEAPYLGSPPGGTPDPVGLPDLAVRA
jgi:hypothetical protein